MDSTRHSGPDEAQRARNRRATGTADAEAASTASGAIDSLVGELKAAARDLAAAEQARAAQRLLELSAALSSSSRSLGDDNLGRLLGTAASGAADRIEGFGHRLEDCSPSELFGEAERLLARHPAATAATALVLGFLAARFVRSDWPPEAGSEAETEDAGGGYAG